MAIELGIDPAHSQADFTVKHMMVTNVRGSFEEISGKVVYDADNLANSTVEAHIKAASITTRVEDRDNHLRSADFLDVETYPELVFKSTNVEPTGDSTAKITGDLTIRGVTKTVVLDAEFGGQGQNPWGQTIFGFAATTKINREDWGLTWNQALETGGVLVGKDIRINLDVEAIPVEQMQPAG